MPNDLRSRAAGRDVERQRGQAPDQRAESVDQLRKYAADFALVLPSHLDGKQWLRLAEGLLRRDTTLASVALANPASFFAALLECARLGLIPGDTYHLVAFGRDVVGIVDYKGEIELMYRAGMVESITCEVVYAQDDFRFKPGQPKPDHSVNWFGGDRGSMIGVYAYANLKGGGTSRVAILNKTEVEAIKAVSKTAKRPDSPWNKWPDRMWRKTALKQLSAWVPTSAEFRTEQLRAESAAQNFTGGYGQIAATPDYAQLPPAPTGDADVVQGEAVEDDPPAGVNPSTGEMHDDVPVEEPPAMPSDWPETAQPGTKEH